MSAAVPRSPADPTIERGPGTGLPPGGGPRVVVPLDGSDVAPAAIPVACALARRLRGHVALVQVDEGTPGERPGRAAREAALQALAADWGARGAAPAGSSATVLDGPDAAAALLAHLAATPAALVVMTTRARGALARAVLGSVADRVAREAPVPVVLVPPRAARPAAAAGPPVGGLRRVLVPLDGSAGAEAVVARLRALPSPDALDGVELVLLRVVVPQLLVGGLVAPDALLAEGALEEDLAHARADLAENAVRLTRDGPGGGAALGGAHDVRLAGHATVRLEARADLSAAHGILEAARAEGADLIAMASRGQRGLRRLALGSTADAVLREAEVPVLLVHPD